jgi:uncharacterized membrane protein YfcA
VSGLELLAVVAVVAGSLAQAVTGFGFALVAAPALVAWLGPTPAVVTVCVLGTLASLPPYLREARHTRWPAVVVWFVPATAATWLVGRALGGVDTGLLAAGAGAAVLVAVALLAAGRSAPRAAGFHGAVLAGAVSGAMNVAGGVGGPPVALYAANAGWSTPRTRATLLAFFALQNVVTVAVLGWVNPPWTTLVGMVAGTAVGVWAARRLPASAVRVAVLATAGIGGAALVVGGLT